MKRQRTILQVEALESRDCPSAPQITAFSATMLSSHAVLLSGTVMDISPTAAVVYFVGVATGSVKPDASGHFQLQRDVSQLGMIYATATDPDGSYSNTAHAALSYTGLSINFSVAQGPNHTVKVTGQISGSSPAGRTVTLSGVVSGSVITNADGTFTYNGTASSLGQIQATVTDDWGITVAKSATLFNAPPVILNFRAINNGNNCWTFTGQVQDEGASGLVVRLGGIPSLDDQDASATVQANGTFSYTITLQPGEHGGVTAECTDLWGLPANDASTFVWN